MSSHHIAIAKASFSAGLLRPDPTSVPRDEITAFHTSFDRTLSHCSPANIQTCKSWLLNYVISSSNRVGVWAKYLVALSGSFTPVEDGKQPTPAGATRVSLSPKRKRLHILYLLNDLFHHTKYHLDSTAAFSTLSGSLQPYIVELLGYAASYDREKHPKHHRRLDDLLEIWADHGYYGADYVDKLREVVKSSALSGPVKTSIGVEENNTESTKKFTGKDAPFIMPSTHGDPSTPYYDLPAGNLVPHIIPDSTVPLRPDSIRPLQFLAGPADAKLVAALKTFMKDVDRIYGPGKPEKNEEDVIDIDDLGQTVIRDGITGDILNGETYYGWSRTFCQQMKKRNQTRDSGDSRRSWSRSRSRSRSPRRRRYSDSADSDDSRRSRSRSRSRRRDYSRSRSSSRRRSRSYSPRGPSPPRSSFPPPHQPQHQQYVPPPGIPVPPPAPFNFPPGGGAPPHGFNPNMVPSAAPPPPPNYQGPWPPLPPPPMPTMGFPPGMNQPAFPPPFPVQGSAFPPMNMGPGHPGYHFPPPHSGSPGPGAGHWQGGYGRGWR
ncbi:hypothetical protein ASPWEDRAFT_115831 [Aspergillus wentii DTO 134E9]|uniref:CID domain-containing protein n=1 Tax=Aspergillus wentii DTO 134E9 TaxID=1073089 RepID=A0A1L9RDK1_ASPWE|nr:uncharacterized protein ASPWEDRAFT_115831 [Aspergillus wentii DTO 134E9]OJJ32984.1 hypothetical protein ASPWEDRAFT_115831 [Aspergillus wentii DTO 134E9]